MKETTTNLINSVIASLLFYTFLGVGFIFAQSFLRSPFGNLIKLPWISSSSRIYPWVYGLLFFFGGIGAIYCIWKLFKITNFFTQIKVLGSARNFFSPFFIKIYIGLILLGAMISFTIGGMGVLLLLVLGLW